jgi:hypothetical protein
MYLYTNNHFAAKSVANALMLKDGVSLPISGTYPKEFLEQYPDLAKIVPAPTEREEPVESGPKPASRRSGR